MHTIALHRLVLITFACSLSGCASTAYFSNEFLDKAPVCFRETTGSQVAVFYVEEMSRPGSTCGGCLVVDAHGHALQVGDDAVYYYTIEDLIERVPPREPKLWYEPRRMFVKARIHLEKGTEFNPDPRNPPLMQRKTPHYELVIDKLLDVKAVPENRSDR